MAGWSDLADRLEELEGIPSRIARPVAEGLTELLQDQFASSHNSYGNAWRPLKPQTVRRKGGDARILLRTDELAAATVARPTAGSGIEITSLDYGTFHQSGTKHMVARKIMPDGAELPPAWRDVIEQAKAEAFGRVLR